MHASSTRAPRRSVACLLGVVLCQAAYGGSPPAEPLAISTEPQFVFDNYVIDNTWAIRQGRESLRRVFHQPQKFEANPILADDGGYVCVHRDERTSKFQMWYQASVILPERGSDYAIAYAESADGQVWTRPKLGLFEWQGSRDNNIVWPGFRTRRASGPFLLDLPEQDRRGKRLVFLYHDSDGLRLIGTDDGIHFDAAGSMPIIKLHSDTQNAIVYDPRGRQYVMYCRAKHIYRTFQGAILDTGESRRIARMTSKELWTTWEAEPQQILVPDDVDEERGFSRFYGMPARYYGGVFWGFLWPFRLNDDIHTELAFSRDGAAFDRLPERPKLIECGPAGAWDSGMVFGGYQWIDVGDEWWMYYAGWNGPHGSRTRKGGIGLVKLRKEGFISMLGPGSGGVLVTRQLVWPGGNLLVNADAREGELKVRVTDGRRKVIPGLDYDDCVAIHGSGVAQEMKWKDRTIADLAGQTIRLEILVRSAHLFTFRATGS